MCKKLEDYMAMTYRMEIIEDEDEGGFAISYPDLPGCITCGETIESAMKNALDAKRTWIEAALEDGIDIYDPSISGLYPNTIELKLPEELQETLKKHAKQEGMSMNQYCIQLLTKNDIKSSIMKRGKFTRSPKIIKHMKKEKQLV